MLEFINVSKQYSNGVNALHNINLLIEAGEFVYIIGPTGSGKSTLIKLIDGEEIATAGQVLVNKTDVGRLRHHKVPYFRRNLGIVFQDNRLLNQKTVFENIYFALEAVGTPDLEARRRVREVLALVGLADKAKAFPLELSGGQQQRCAIARAIANRPMLLIADEPTGNLDPNKSKEIISLLERINREENTTVLMVTHDEIIVNLFKKRTIALENGFIVADIQQGGYFQNA